MNDLSLNYQMIGDGPPLLLVHGFGISFEIWKALAPLLRQHFTLVMVELPGIGKSPMARGDYLSESVNALERLRLSLGFEKWDVLGYSTGSRIAESYVRMFAPQVGRAIFLCPLFVDPLKSISLRFALWTDSRIPLIGNFILRGRVLYFLIVLLGFNLRPDPLAEEWFDLIGAVHLDVLRATLKIADRFCAQRFDVPVPFSLIWGKADVIVTAPRRRSVRDHFVKSNHATPVLAADDVSRIILGVLTPR